MKINSKTPLETLEMDGGNSWNNMKIPTYRSRKNT